MRYRGRTRAALYRRYSVGVTFPDHFSGVAAQYAASRPRYPDALFAWLARLAPAHALAWDAGCGNGQASTGLAAHFASVIATDASAPQIANAESQPRVDYGVCGETNAALADHSVDLVTVAQALHWFDRAIFYREVERVLTARGVLAVWTYDVVEIDPAVDTVIRAWYHETLGPYWPPERAHVESQYRDIGFPYSVLAAPSFDMSVLWTRVQFIAYLRTWSAVKEYFARVGDDAIQLVQPVLDRAWSDEQQRVVRWPLTLLAGYARTECSG